jgi:hypothetical protein
LAGPQQPRNPRHTETTVEGLLTEDIVLRAGSGVFPPPRPSLMCLGIVVFGS